MQYFIGVRDTDESNAGKNKKTVNQSMTQPEYTGQRQNPKTKVTPRYRTQYTKPVGNTGKHRRMRMTSHMLHNDITITKESSHAYGLYINKEDWRNIRRYIRAENRTKVRLMKVMERNHREET